MFSSCGFDHTERITELTPIPFLSGRNVSGIGPGFGHTMFLSNNTIFVCGSNSRGQFGNGSRDSTRNTPIVDSKYTVKSIHAGYAHNIVIMTDGTVLGFGDNAQNQLHGNSDAAMLAPIQVTQAMNQGPIIDCCCGQESSVFLTSAGKMIVLGLLHDLPSNKNTHVGEIGAVASISVGRQVLFALTCNVMQL